VIVRNLVFAICLVLASPAICSAQSVIQSELTRVTLTSSAEPDGRITLQASVTTQQGGGVAGGTVQFIDETTLAVLGWADTAHPSIVVDRLAPGPHRVRADYSGTMQFLPLMLQPSESVALVIHVRDVPGVTLSSSGDLRMAGALVTLTATVSGPAGPLSGAVTFRDGSQVLAAHVGLDRAGEASFTTSALAEGSRAIVAEYEGGELHAPAASPQLRQDVGARERATALRGMN
jgi:hypothetical protein